MGKERGEGRGEKGEGRRNPHVAMGEWEGEFKRQMDTNKEEEDTDSRGTGSGREDNGIRHYA